MFGASPSGEVWTNWKKKEIENDYDMGLSYHYEQYLIFCLKLVSYNICFISQNKGHIVVIREKLL